MNPPAKPFANYKWRWATLTCTEGLNEPTVYLGILRVMHEHEGKRPSDPELVAALQRVEKQTNTNVSLARDAGRNILRNSGQYWKALELMVDSRTGIELTSFGRKVASGQLTSLEFAATAITRLTLPNPHIDKQNLAEWRDLRVKPLQLILQIVATLYEKEGELASYITVDELIKIVIPLAGENAPLPKHLEAILLYRDDQLDLTGWPDCAKGANDKRMAREFLLFLDHYGFCKVVGTKRANEKYYLALDEIEEITILANIDISEIATLETSRQIIKSELTASVERKRVLVKTLERSNQSKFRKDVLNAFNMTCFLTGVQVSAVLEASHIVPVSSRGVDRVSNGLCLRADVHRLYDSGHLRLSPDGQVHLSESAAEQHNYGMLPKRINFPDFIDESNVTWRWQYI